MKVIKVCADPFPPYQFIDEDGQIKGSDYEIVTDRLRRAGYEPEVWIAPWNQIYRAFEAGEQDVLFQVQDSPERLEKFYFSKLLRHAVTEVVTADPKLQEIPSHSGLSAYKVGVIAGFANGPEIDDLPEYCKVEYPGTEELLEGILSGSVDCGVCDQGVKEYLRSEEMTLYAIPELTYKRPLYVMFRSREQRDEFDMAGE